MWKARNYCRIGSAQHPLEQHYEEFLATIPEDQKEVKKQLNTLRQSAVNGITANSSTHNSLLLFG